MSLPYYKRYPRDFLDGCIGMSLEVKGAYAVVLDLIYMRDGKLPDDERYIAGQLGCSVRKWNSIKNELLERGKLLVESGFISNFRADFLLEETRKYRDKQAENRTNSNKNKGVEAPSSSYAGAGLNSDTDTDNCSPKGECQPKPDPLPVKEAFDLWNKLASRLRLPVAKDLTETRRKHIRARLSTAGIEGWMEALSAVEASPMCRGENDRGWRADLDFVCQPKSFAKLREGSYAADGKPRQANAPPAAPSAMSPELQAKRRAMLEAEDA